MVSSFKKMLRLWKIILLLLVQIGLFTIPAGAGTPPAIEKAIIQPETPSAIPTETPSDQSAGSGPTAASPADRISLDYFKGYFIDTGKMLISPIKWEAKDWLKAGLVVGITSGLYFADEHIRDIAKHNQSGVGDVLATIGNSAGENRYILPTLGALYLYGHVADNAKARKAALLSVESYFITGLFTQVLKVSAHRHRPERIGGGRHYNKWEGPQLNNDNLSFPSGHTSSAFSMATIIAGIYEDSPVIPPLAYGLATLTGLARVYTDSHWSSDVFFAAAIGYFTGKALLHYHKDDKEKRVRIIPDISPSRAMLMVEYKF